MMGWKPAVSGSEGVLKALGPLPRLGGSCGIKTNHANSGFRFSQKGRWNCIQREINRGKAGGTSALITEASFLSGKVDIL